MLHAELPGRLAGPTGAQAAERNRYAGSAAP
jgi:hypothetical protein